MPWDLGEEADPPIWHDHPIDKYRTKAAFRKATKPIDCVVYRDEWGAVPPTATEKIRHNAPFFFEIPPAEMGNHIHFTHSKTPECTTTEECIKLVKGMQEEHMKNGETDILPNFLVGGDGKVYEGRGWFTLGKVPEDFQATLIASLEFCMIGNYSKKNPPKIMKDALKKVTEWAILNKKLYCCYKKTYDFEFYKMFFGQIYY